MSTNELNEKVQTLLKEGTWFAIDQIIDLLSSETDKGKALDPFQNPDRLIWNDVGVNLLINGMLLESLTVFQSFLNCCYDLQQKYHERIHKGTPLQYLGIVNRHLGQLEQSKKYHILAFIEDVINSTNVPQDGSVLKSPASIVLLRSFRMREKELLSLQNTVLASKLETTIFYPETMLTKWIQDNEKNQAVLVARSKEEFLYKTNLPYLAELKGKAIEDKTGESLELLATYLFSCVDGFEPILRRTTKAFHFDLIVRNLVKNHSLLESLGEYIAVECKNIDQTITAQQLNHFIQKLRLHNIKCGVVFTNKGVSGIRFKGAAYGKEILMKTFNRDGIVIFDITRSDLERLSEGDNLLSLLLRKYEDYRFM
jgi:hypothetical protein